jgi:RNA polymerase sigma factor (sigma-70 family)
MSLHAAAGASRSVHPAPEAQQAARGRVLLEQHFDLIQQKLLHLGRRSGLPDHEAEELRSWALFRLVEGDYQVLARWEGRSAFATYLTVVLVNLMRDYRIRLWGKRRPSAAARRQGCEAVLFERIWLQGGLPLEQAIERISRESGSALSRGELERLADELPRRIERRRVSDEVLYDLAHDGRVESRVEDGELARTAACLRQALLPAFQALPAEDRQLLKLHYQDGLALAAISRLQGRPQRQLYSARDRCLKRLRQAIEAAGLTGPRVNGLIGWSPQELHPGRPAAGSGARPGRRPERGRPAVAA